MFYIDSPTIKRHYFYWSEKGKNRNLEEKWEKNKIKMDKYCLEYIGHILKKHKVKRIYVSSIGDTKLDDKTYTSTDWKFENIEHIK
ncbi:hypothetical protein COB55_03545 [Candidatus Wolfebacteria bacterium]|nr:MAG: hypothetical protein COB55_03545 [Candidatus Wolfebacteria bacterium]